MSKKPSADTSASTQSSSTTGEAAVLTPASTPGGPQRSTSVSFTTLRQLHTDEKMDDKDKDNAAVSTDRQGGEAPAAAKAEHGPEDEASKQSSSKKKSKCRKPEHKHRKTVKKSSGKKSRHEQSDSESSSEDDSDADSSDESSSEDEPKKRKSKKSKSVKKSKDKKGRKKVDDESDDDDSDADESEGSSSASEVETKKRKSKKAKAVKKSKDKKLQKSKKAVETSESEGSETASDDASGEDDKTVETLQAQRAELKRQIAVAQKLKTKKRRSSIKSLESKKKSSKKDGSVYYKRVDQLWDSTIHNYKLKESADDDDSEFAEYAFLVRRTFDWENKYRDTVVDIKSKQLRAALSDVMKDCKSVSLEAEEPTIDPNILFLYLEELRTHYKKTLKAKIKAEKKRKLVKKLEQQRSLLKTLVSYIDEDYMDTKKTLYPLLAAGNITFDLLWALFHPNDIAITSCYGTWEEPRCFKVEYANKCQSMTRGEWYCIEGRYLEYDGKGFGFGDFEVDVDAFKGPRKITSLATYPLKYHKDPEKVKKQIIERGERFVDMDGMHYKFHKGLAFMKKKKQVLKININGRIMVDPATFRRINPNYPISWIKPKETDDLFGDSDDEDSEDGCCSCAESSDDEDTHKRRDDLENKFDEDRTPKYKYKWTENERGDPVFLAVEVDEDGEPIRPQHVDRLAENPDLRNKSFTQEELLLTSPVMLGFAFSEKLWLEFSISGVHDITYNEDAFDSLVLPPNQKSIVRALVESHKFHAAKAIDDVVQGKGKGLVAVLHGPPGTGKTLTAEGISELLKCPLYMVSAGELGTDPARLEHELQKILDIAHSWGAVLLLDEADVFLEKREVHDIHRNALVSTPATNPKHNQNTYSNTQY